MELQISLVAQRNMETIIDGCRLCLDSFAENSCTIESPDLKQQMQKVFPFTIDCKEGYPTNVCQSCSYTISEFYQYAEKVRLNQERLSNTAPSGEYKLSFEVVTIDPDTELKYSINHDDSKDLCDIIIPSDVNEGTSGSKDDNGNEGSIINKKVETDISSVKSESGDESSGHETNTESGKPAKPLDESESTKKVPGKHKAKRDQDDIQLNVFFKMDCELCGESAKNFSALLKHFRTNHTRSGYVVCCKTKLFRRAHLLHHMALHTNPNAFRCELCDKCYKNKAYLHHHNIRVHGNESDDRPFKCDLCSQAFTKRCLLRTHSCKQQKVKCPECDKQLSKGALRLHLTNMHSKTDRKMICDTCGQGFLNKLCFENHIRMHIGIEVQKFQCPICQKWIKGEHDLKRHIRIIHYEKGQTHICDVCNKQYPNSKALNKHKGLVHVEKKFECEFCGKKFKHALNLKEHRTIHTGEVLYSCDICGTTMNSKANLYTHTKKSHPVEWAEKRSKAAEVNIPNKQA
ncbi:transcription factor grauzone-like [Toxorhynchites rutilus septentrionalis]|uniref:transcription factor grauzone-like n=1 Tax=Toxorhynchites rutilus septentrionalis TaxID=329112 RepID=UPI00247B1BB3|nr:transcription factor grauzone-like [Toxorhynchites rutilus septentrionalis]